MPATFIAIIALAASATTPDLKALYDSSRLSELRAAGQVSKLPTFYRGAVDAAFNDVASAEKSLLAALDPPPGLEWQRHEARAQLIALYGRAGRYRETLFHVDKGLIEVPHWQDLRDARALYAAQARFPEQSVASHKFAKIRGRMEDLSLSIPLQVNGRRVEFLVDTGASHSIISESEARRLGLAVSDSGEASITDSVGARVSIRMAMANELTIGSTRIRNALFLVVGDEMQPFASLGHGKRGVIGFPILIALQRIRWNGAGEFEIGFASPPKKPEQPNLLFIGQRIFAELRFPEGRLGAFIDTGASGSYLLPRFATDYPQVVKLGVKGSEQQAGASGSVDVSLVRLPNMRWWIRDLEVTVNDVPVHLEETGPGLQNTHVALGMDVMSQLGPVTIDFNAMSFSIGR